MHYQSGRLSQSKAVISHIHQPIRLHGHFSLHDRTRCNSLIERAAFAKQCGDSTHSPAHFPARATLVHGKIGHNTLSEHTASPEQAGDMTHPPARPLARAVLMHNKTGYNSLSEQAAFAKQCGRVRFTVIASGFCKAIR